jgi:XTP/dITP diphosphohydrolase
MSQLPSADSDMSERSSAGSGMSKLPSAVAGRSAASARRWVLASNNAGKLREFSALFESWDIEVVAQGQLGVGEAEEPFGTFLENALTKARHASRATGLPAIADDSGLTVAALDGAPGVKSARYAQTADGHKSDAANNALLLQNMGNQTDRRCAFVCVLVFVRHADDPDPVVARGQWNGVLAASASGDGGFGYDPLFFVPSLQQSAAQLPAAIKNTISHRAQALQQLRVALQAAGLV